MQSLLQNSDKLILSRVLLFIIIFTLMSNLAFSAVASITISNQTQPSTPGIPGTTDNEMLKFALQAGNGQGPTWSALTVTKSGTATNSNITVKVCKDSNGNGTWDGSATDLAIGTIVLSSTTANFTFSEAVSRTLTYYYIIVDINVGESSSNSLGLSITNASSYTVDSPGGLSGGTWPQSTGDKSLPVELSLWEATSGNGAVNLHWITESEIENQGFIIERKANHETEFKEIASFITDEELMGQGSTTRRTIYEFTDYDVESGVTYYYSLSDVDYVSTVTHHDVVSVTVRSEGELQQPSSITLQDAYPNPFNPLVNLGFTLEDPADINLSVYDLQGKLVQAIAQGYHGSGKHALQWDGLNAQGEPQGSGVYLVHISSAHDNQIQRITLLR